MKKIFLIALLGAGAWSVQAQTTAKKPVATAKAPVKTVAVKNPLAANPAPKTQAPLVLKSTLDSASYAFGFSMGSQLKSGGLKGLNYDALLKGLKDIFNGESPALSEELAQQCITNLFTEMGKQKEVENKVKYATQIKESEDFLAQNKAKAGVKTTASGLQYEIIKEGTGEKPTALDQVTVHYKGSLLNGYEFDSSYKRNEPATFRLGMVIKGWTEGLQLMKEGSHYRFFIPYELGYGATGTRDGGIPPYSTLIFEVELIKVGE